VGRAFGNDQVVGGGYMLVPLNLDRLARIDRGVGSSSPDRSQANLAVGELLLRLGTGFPPDNLIPDSVELLSARSLLFDPEFILCPCYHRRKERWTRMVSGLGSELGSTIWDGTYHGLTGVNAEELLLEPRIIDGYVC
jgi:hypothetical protein